MIEQLRYVRLAVDDIAEAGNFAERILGLERVERSEELATYRSDHRDYTLAFATGGKAVQSVGFEVRYPDDLDTATERLSKLGIEAQRGSGDDCALRKVKDMLFFHDASGNRIELVVRPMNTGWRYFPSRDAGIKGLAATIFRSREIEKDLAIWTALGAKVSDWAGDAAYLNFDDAHHRIMLYPAEKSGVLTVEFEVESVNLLMRNYYVLQNLQVPVVHGPGRRPASEQLFLTFPGPGGVLFSFVAEGLASPPARPRQFAAGPEGLCGWGSTCKIAEFNAASHTMD